MLIKMKIKLIIFVIYFLNLFNTVFSNIDDKILAKIETEIITNFDIINEVNTILALSNRTANKDDLKSLQNVAFSSLKKRLIKSKSLLMELEQPQFPV